MQGLPVIFHSIGQYTQRVCLNDVLLVEAEVEGDLHATCVLTDSLAVWAVSALILAGCVQVL